MYDVLYGDEDKPARVPYFLLGLVLAVALLLVVREAGDVLLETRDVGSFPSRRTVEYGCLPSRDVRDGAWDDEWSVLEAYLETWSC